MSDILIRSSMPRDCHWGYDDPSGVAEEPFAVRLPETMRGSVERAAAREGQTATQWVVSLVTRTLLPTGPKAA
jgi:hypothetical protein